MKQLGLAMLISLVMSLTLISPPRLARPASLISSISHYFLKTLDALTHWLAFTLIELNEKNSVQQKSSGLFLGRFVAGRPGRKQEVSVVAVGTGGEQKNWSRLEGKWVWWALPPISQIPTDHKTDSFAATETYSRYIRGRDFLKTEPAG